MKIVITGGAGFIGSALALELQDKHEVLIVDKMCSSVTFENGNLESFGHFKNILDFEGELYVGDINDEKTLNVIKDFKPDVIFHKAAISDTTVYDQNKVLKTNLNTFKGFIELALELNAKLIYASSASVYGDAPSPQTVNLSEAPKNPYAFSKLMMDKLAKKYFDKMHIIGLRYFNVYGKGEFFKNTTASMILQFGHQILAGKSPRLFEGSDQIYRDFVYIKDVVSANLQALEAKSGIYNIATGKARTFQDIVDILQKELNTNYPCKYIPNPYKNAYQFHTQAKLDESFSYKANFSLEEGIKDYLDEIKRLYEKEVNA
ncbi:ADP-L-glycero-D-mannoheptose-6-epimerase [Campylobacter subantarcticus LMG 24377]|uniref:ADP-L-glycero-D-mannoheptose-6-epimerase n=2 Tax=Campylobacter subantarcticus TaxID=497724 RepID=A0A0A8H8S4_9BACT|nr:ADP-glyceromanno-heptose 6-epimerase [Campylobacter subantarcticus]EAJ1261604.1 ADP-glyceromanno-heptose 6-epimerase [Campylobacter lari]AJC90382.1 ADP-L-glycero-D-mannoheptose-6-epimerase [Campylobacter subantarcticus LMG 24374]AJC92044.1 ADP-L-glycero-D-mannoheptose-6-epimerase [Campylobacter subantarcticus LMG 24377]EAL3939631.1 ADP-glyceromanno-heptose 6-epimerase [Campylobacter lari]MPB99308.1 ADP-glyceromanno-heptose 6-epimerase [Campylobacter subantarcticus]